MTDAGEFERLVTAVLRRADPAAAAIVHSGVNAGGRPIPGPVDGFAVYPSEAGELLLCAHTTMAVTSLGPKWLEPGKGDLDKAAGKARELYFPSARLVLSTNHEPPLDVVADAHRRAAALGLKLDVWHASRLADFLDDDAEGQWVRHRFFGVPAHRLAWTGMQEIAAEGPVDVRIFDNPMALAPRAAADDLVDQFECGVPSILLVAASGQGKTVIASQVWRSLADQGAGALHVDHQDVESSVSLVEAVTRALRRRAPDLSEHCGAELEAFAAQRTVLVLIEDINHAARPEEALRKVVGWMRQTNAPGLRILCPVWPQALAKLPEQERGKIGALSTRLDLPTTDEALVLTRSQAAAQGVRKSDHELATIARRLGGDPLLIGLQDYDGAGVGSVRDYLHREAARIGAGLGRGASEVFEALEALGEHMIRELLLAPSWAAVRGQLNGEQVELIRQLILGGAVLRLTPDGDREILTFRHDRVRDEIRALGLRRVLASTDKSVAADPAYGEVWGLILSDPSSDIAHVAMAAEHNPLGLFHGLAECAEDAHERRAALTQAAERWLDQPHGRADQRLRWACQFAIRDFVGPEALGLLARFKERNWFIEEAKLVNGDFEAALRVTMMLDPFALWDRETRMFGHLRVHHAQTMRTAISAELGRTDLSDTRFAAVIGLAGRLRLTGLEAALAACWSARPRTADFVAAMLWASALCAPSMLPDVLTAWSRLSKRAPKSGSSPRNAVHNRVRSGLWRLAPHEALPHLTARGKNPRDALFWQLGGLLEGWDHPDAQEYVVRQLAAASRDNARRGGAGLFGLRIGRTWRNGPFSDGERMSLPSLERLESLWRAGEEDIEVRRMALLIWGYAAPAGRAGLARSIDVAGPLGPDAVRVRLMLADPAVAEDFQQLLKLDLRHLYLWQVVRRHWQEALLPVLEWSLEQRRRAEAGEIDPDLVVD